MDFWGPCLGHPYRLDTLCPLRAESGLRQAGDRTRQAVVPRRPPGGIRPPSMLLGCLQGSPPASHRFVLHLRRVYQASSVPAEGLLGHDHWDPPRRGELVSGITPGRARCFDREAIDRMERLRNLCAGANGGAWITNLPIEHDCCTTFTADEWQVLCRWQVLSPALGHYLQRPRVPAGCLWGSCPFLPGVRCTPATTPFETPWRRSLTGPGSPRSLKNPSLTAPPDQTSNCWSRARSLLSTSTCSRSTLCTIRLPQRRLHPARWQRSARR